MAVLVLAWGGLAMLPFLCGCGLQGGYASPQALFDAEFDATYRRDVKTMLGCVHPQLRPAYRRTLEAWMQYRRELGATTSAIRRRFGEEVSTGFAGYWAGLIQEQPPFSRFVKNRRIDWSRVPVRYEGNLCYVGIPRDEVYCTIRLGNGKWYRLFYDTYDLDVSLTIVKSSESLLLDGVRQLKELRQQVRNGSCTKAQLMDSIRRTPETIPQGF